MDDEDYIKVGASMAGIHTLRTRPGLAMDATVVSGPSAKLEKLSPYQVCGGRGACVGTACGQRNACFSALGCQGQGIQMVAVRQAMSKAMGTR